MKKKMMFWVFALMVIAATVAHARRGRATVFIMVPHPLAGYAMQIR